MGARGLQHLGTAADPPHMSAGEPSHLYLPPIPSLHTLRCGPCLVEHVERVAEAVAAQWPEAGDPWVAALRIVVGEPLSV